MQRTRRSNLEAVPSIHESVEMLAACESKEKGEKSRENGKRKAGTPASNRNEREETPIEISAMSSLEVPEQPVRRKRERVSLGSLNSFGGATPEEEIDLRTPPNRKRTCIGAARASQARLFGLPPGSLGLAEKKSKRKKTEADYDPLFMKAVRAGLANSARAQEEDARKKAQASQEKPPPEAVKNRSNKDTEAPSSLSSTPTKSKHRKSEADYDPLYMKAVRAGLANSAKAREEKERKEAQAIQEKPSPEAVKNRSNKDTQVNQTELGITQCEVSVQTSSVRKKSARKPVKGAAQLVREANRSERRSMRNRTPSEASEAVLADDEAASKKDNLDNKADREPSKEPETLVRAVRQGEESERNASPSDKDAEEQDEKVLECPPGHAAPGGSLEVSEQPSAIDEELPECPEDNLEGEETAVGHNDAPEEESLSEHERAVNAAVKLLKGRLLGLDGWKGMQKDEGVLPLTGELREHYDKLYTLLAETVENGLNVSALLLGPRGNRKTTVVERVVYDLQEAFGERVSVVRLNGLVHSDERVALKEIARQLCEDNELAVSKVSTFELNLRFLTDVLTECVKAHRAVVFVLEEFDLFAQRPKQTLLYNLLDAIQSSKTQAAVVGISCRLDADELLEKRVRSRFSHRRLQFLEPPVPELLNLLSDALHLPPSFPHAVFAARFNKKAEAVLADPDVQAILDNHVSYNQTPRHILDLGFRALCNMDRTRGHLTVEDLKSARAVREAEPRVESIKGLSVLELYLLIAMKRLEEKERDKYNFQMVFAEYQEARSQHTADQYPRGVSLRAFQHLIGRELVTFADRRPRSDPMEFRPVKLLVDAAEIEKGLKGHPQRSSAFEQWFANKAAGKF